MLTFQYLLIDNEMGKFFFCKSQLRNSKDHFLFPMISGHMSIEGILRRTQFCTDGTHVTTRLDMASLHVQQDARPDFIGVVASATKPNPVLPIEVGQNFSRFKVYNRFRDNVCTSIFKMRQRSLF